jgi:hypothetical protein
MEVGGIGHTILEVVRIEENARESKDISSTEGAHSRLWCRCWGSILYGK